MPTTPALHALPSRLLASLLLIASAPAQADASKRSQLFTLVAGEHPVRALVDLTAQIRKVRIHWDEAELGAGDQRVVVQRELRLDGDSFEDVATTLLFYCGFLIVPAEEAGEYRVIAVRKAPDPNVAVSRTPEQILARPARVEFVTTKVALGEGPDVVLRVSALRPLLASLSLRVKADGSDLVLTGSTEQIAFALRTLQLYEGKTPATMPEIVWRGMGALAWPGGKTSQAAFTKLLAATLDANTLDGNAIAGAAEVQVDLGEPTELAAADWFARATQVLRKVDQVIVPVDRQHRVFVLRSLQDPRAREICWSSYFEAPDQVAKSAAILPVVTAYDLQHVEVTAAMNRLRPKFAAMRNLTFGTMTGRRLLLSGLRDDVGDMLASLREIDVEGK